MIYSWINFLSVLAGAIFTFLSLWIIENYKNKNKKREKEQNFKLFIKQELLSLSKNIEKLKSIFENRNWFDLLTVTQIEKNTTNIENQRRDSIYLSTLKLQEDFADLITDISNLIAGMRIIESNYLDKMKEMGELKSEKEKDDKFKELQGEFNQRRTLRLIDLIEIQRRIDEYVKRL